MGLFSKGVKSTIQNIDSGDLDGFPACFPQQQLDPIASGMLVYFEGGLFTDDRGEDTDNREKRVRMPLRG